MEPQEIYPGDTLVVPVERGGLDCYGWAPDSSATVVDVADAVRFSSGAATGRRRLRVDAETARRLGVGAEDAGWWQRWLRDLWTDDHDGAVGEDEIPIGQWLAQALQRTLVELGERPAGHRVPTSAWTPDGLRALQAWAASGVKVISLVERWGGGGGASAYGSRPGEGRYLMVASHADSREIERDDELVECSSVGSRRVALRVHHRNVGDRARDIASAIGLPPKLAAAVEAAARWHDLGKVESRFQAMLCGGDLFDAMILDEPLGKSGTNPDDRVAWRRSRIRSGLPAGARHEAWSAAIVRAYLAEAATDDIDPDLVIHLVASHHGHARPWLPPVYDDHPGVVVAEVDGAQGDGATTEVTVRSDQTVDFSHPLRFARLNQRYGRWGLALLETIVRCSDMTVSAEGS